MLEHGYLQGQVVILRKKTGESQILQNKECAVVRNAPPCLFLILVPWACPCLVFWVPVFPKSWISLGIQAWPRGAGARGVLDLRQTLGVFHKIWPYFVSVKLVLCPALKEKLNLRHFFPHFSIKFSELPMEFLELILGSLNPRCSVGLDLHLPGFP